MPSLIDLRAGSAPSSLPSKITQAMETVAASKMRRAQDRIVGARPYSPS